MPRNLLQEKDISSLKSSEHTWRRAVLRDTVEKFSLPNAPLRYAEQAQKNHQQWKLSSRAQEPKQVRVLAGDWGDVTHDLSRSNGEIYAVLNMANAYGPGGGYLEGMVAQEENMYRRSDCHFYVKDSEMNHEKNRYLPEVSDLINGVSGKVYLDHQNPRICIKGSEQPKTTGYEDLPPEDYFLFYELKAAADDLRNGRPFNEASMRRKIIAQLDTLKANNIRHVVLSAFGCGAFANPAVEVARIYREELAKRWGDFDDVVFAVYHAGYGPDNFTPFKNALDGLPLQSNEQIMHNKKLLLVLEENVNRPVWNQRGFAVLFFDFRKTPNGIVKIRNILNNEKMDDFTKITALQRIAQERLDNPPRFTKRDDKAQALYKNIVNIDFNTIDENSLSLFSAEGEADTAILKV